MSTTDLQHVTHADLEELSALLGAPHAAPAPLEPPQVPQAPPRPRSHSTSSDESRASTEIYAACEGDDGDVAAGERELCDLFDSATHVLGVLPVEHGRSRSVARWQFVATGAGCADAGAPEQLAAVRSEYLACAQRAANLALIRSARERVRNGWGARV